MTVLLVPRAPQALLLRTRYRCLSSRAQENAAGTAVAAAAAAAAASATRLNPGSMWGRASRVVGIYLELSKARLASLVTLTAMVGYAIAPTKPSESEESKPMQKSNEAMEDEVDDASWRRHVRALMATAVGTGLCAASANTFNQILEAPFDAQMARTRTRPLARMALRPIHATVFAITAGITGVTVLATGANTLAAALGAGNIALYAGVYTPLKRVAGGARWALCTHAGAVVGAIPPLMGWAASTGSLDPRSGDAGAYVLAYLLHAWQFPHFNALSCLLRREYARAGYFGIACAPAARNARQALFHAVALSAAVPFAAIATGTVDHERARSYAAVASVANAPLVIMAARHWAQPNHARARVLFFTTLLHLPLALLALLAHRSENKREKDAEIPKTSLT